jgi:hypothetical protein
MTLANYEMILANDKMTHANHDGQHSPWERMTGSELELP